MASTAPATQDTMVTLKVNIEGTNRRLKLPLRDLGAHTLPDKLRFLLSIPPTSDAIFERYSDSAAAFVTLDPNNASVYKQLYRAAKAKLKLRLKVTIKDKESESLMSKRATVEDEVTEDQAQPAATPRASLVDDSSVSDLEQKKSVSPSVAEIQRGFETLLSASRKPAPSSSAIPVSCFSKPVDPTTCSSDIPVTKGPALRDRWFAELAGLKLERDAAVRTRGAPVNPHVSSYSVFCNKCNSPIPDAHYHCGTCDDGDFDLCQSCIDKGVLCDGDGHWMIKRFLMNGKVINSVTETLEPRSHHNDSKTTIVEETKEIPEELCTRTCNSCVQEYSEEKFVTCKICDDYDLCIPCHSGVKHGHNPRHGFAPAVEDTKLDVLSELLLDPGRNISHSAICDGCDKYIYGARHKCLDCPDWDYCAECIENVEFIHPGHRFVALFEPAISKSESIWSSGQRAFHVGIYCDGPLCSSSSSYIRGDRYKCAVCHDTDFCASCEASPSNLHNKTHPLLKFKTPIRNVSVTTMCDNNNQTMPVMGDRINRTTSKSTETTPSPTSNAAIQVQTVAELKPSEAVKIDTPKAVEPEPEVQPKVEAVLEKDVLDEKKPAVEEELVAHFVRDSVPDGTPLAPNTVFEQTWVLRNGGTKAWPAGCTVKFVGGDNMCANDPNHPASVHELVSAAESTTCYSEIAPGQEAGFTVLLRTPVRPGKVISYWRLTGPTGLKFGHRLWCDVSVQEPAPTIEETKEDKDSETSQMIFPTLEKESPETSIHEETSTVHEPSEVDEFDDMVDEEDLDDETEDGFLTDEEYDILDASDEEYLADQEKAVKK